MFQYNNGNIMKTKMQSTFEFTALQAGLLILTIMIIGFLYYYYSTISNSISSTNLYSISSIYFYGNPGQGSQSPYIYGTLQLSIFSPRTPDFSSSQSYLIQSMNSSFSSNCNISGISAFTTNGYYCLSLSNPSSILPEGNNKYLIEFTGVTYNTTAYNIMNTTEPSTISYFVVNLNGKYAVQKISPPDSIQIS